jgi:hypothetical protein
MKHSLFPRFDSPSYQRDRTIFDLDTGDPTRVNDAASVEIGRFTLFGKAFLMGVSADQRLIVLGYQRINSSSTFWRL